MANRNRNTNTQPSAPVIVKAVDTPAAIVAAAQMIAPPAGKRKSTILKVVLEGPIVNYNWADGTKDVIDWRLLQPAMQERSGTSGLTHTVRDATAKSEDASTAEKIAAGKKRIETIKSGKWESVREVQPNELFLAVSRAYVGKPYAASVEAFDAWVAARADAQKVTQKQIRAGLEELPSIAAALAEMRAESTKSVDKDALLAEMEAA